jgi:hypothetical protein
MDREDPLYSQDSKIPQFFSLVLRLRFQRSEIIGPENSGCSATNSGGGGGETIHFFIVYCKPGRMVNKIIEPIAKMEMTIHTFFAVFSFIYFVGISL